MLLNVSIIIELTELMPQSSENFHAYIKQA